MRLAFSTYWKMLKKTWKERAIKPKEEVLKSWLAVVVVLRGLIPQEEAILLAVVMVHPYFREAIEPSQERYLSSSLVLYGIEECFQDCAAIGKRFINGVSSTWKG